VELITGSESQVEEDEDEEVWVTRINGDDPEKLDEVAEQLEELFLNVPGVFGIRSSEEEQPNEMALVIDRERSQRYGINPQAVAGVVGYALRGQNLPKYRDEGREIPVRVRYEEEDREDLEALSSFLLPTASGTFLPLGTVTDVKMVEAPQYIVRRDKRIGQTITLDLASETADETRKRLDFIRGRINLPEGVRFEELRVNRDEDLRAMQYALLVSILFIYLLMGLLFESFILPLSIVFTIPLAAFGVFWAHLLKGLDLDFLGMVGLVLLVGVVVNNGIVLVDTVNRLRAAGLDRRTAILTATERRFRPIMMTAITTIGGMVPLAINGRLESGISYTSFAWTLIGGLSTATLLTLLVVPVFYTFFDDLGRHFGALTAGVRRVPALRRRLGAAPAD
jgi:HAE1 family hydrophobic/amphiphilic exporter-1